MTDAFLHTTHKINRRHEGKSRIGSRFAGTGHESRYANSEAPSDIKLIGHPRKVNGEREKQVQDDCNPNGLRTSKRSGIDL